MDREKPDKRVRTSVFLESSLIKRAQDFAGERNKVSTIIRFALECGLNELEREREMGSLRRAVLEAARVEDFVRAGELIDEMATLVGKASPEQLRDAVNAALAKREFERARMCINRLEYLTDRSATTPDLDELYEALDDQEFDIARNILGALRQRWEERTASPDSPPQGA